MNRCLRCAALVSMIASLVTLCVDSGMAAVREVCPSGCPLASIQAAIDASADGDTVLVHDGRYVENVNFKNKAITVRSVNGPGFNVIDGGLGSTPVVTFDSFEGPDSVLDGFTVTGGRAVSGAGIKITDASPLIVNCVVAGNRSAYGGGIWISGGMPVIRDSVITGNHASDRGSGMYAQSAGMVTLERCTVSGNTGSVGLFFLQSGAVVADSDIVSNIGGIYFNNCPLTVRRSRVFGNEGAGIVAEYPADFLLVDSLVIANQGRGISLAYPRGGSRRIVRSVIAGNDCTGCTGGGIHLYQTNLSVESSLIVGNRADQGGGIYVHFSTISLDGVTVAGNTAIQSGGGISASDATVVNSVFWGNIAGSSDPQINTQGGGPLVSVTWSDIQGGWAGEGNINQDPLFVAPAAASAPFSAGDYRLRANSPCIDAGSGDPPAGLDLQGDPTPQGGGRDMGADEYALLANGSFESAAERVPVPWVGKRLSLKDGLAVNTAHSGRASFLLTGTAVAKELGQMLAHSGSAGDVLDLSCWHRANSPSAAGGLFGVVMTIHHADGTRGSYTMEFAKETHDWKKGRRTFTALKDYTKIKVSLVYANQRGKAWFDDVKLAVLKP